MIHAHLFRKFWSKALAVVCYIINRLFIKSLRRMISYETWYEKQSDLSELKMYDCDVYVVDYQIKSNDKMISRSWIETLIDYERKNQWRIYNETRVMIKRDVIFNEIKLIYKKSQSADSVATESMKNDDSMKHVNLTDLLQSMRMRNTDLHQSNVESNQSITVLD
jgi:trehalose/maltose hydrolase-like predicted phosphorylase